MRGVVSYVTKFLILCFGLVLSHNPVNQQNNGMLPWKQCNKCFNIIGVKNILQFEGNQNLCKP